jgi:hypothetical protein
MESKDEVKRKKRKEVIQLTFVAMLMSILIAVLVGMNIIIEDAPAPWKDPLGFIWYIITQHPPTGWTPAQWPFITWIMIFLLPIALWMVSVYEYFTGFYDKWSKLFWKVLLAWLIATLVLFFASIIIRDIAYYGFTDTAIAFGIILAIILIGILKERLS